jgi:cyclically-permuted mutarotase family protein
MNKFFLLLFFIQSLFVFSPISAQKTDQVKWSAIATLPFADGAGKNPGVAGAFCGVHNNVLLIGGGANFPDAMPWEGGKKKYWDEVYVLTRFSVRNFGWVKKQNDGIFKLKRKIAYGASVTTGEGIVCIGGENENGISKEVFLLQWDAANRQVSEKELPGLPLALTNSAAAGSGKMIYVAGGETVNAVSNKFFSLDLTNTTAGWKELPVIPKALSHTVMLCPSPGKILLMGGRRKGADGISELFNSVFEFDFTTNRWLEKKSMPCTLSAGTGTVKDENTVLLFGGDKGETFHQTEVLLAAIAAEKDEVKKKELVEQKNKLQQRHPGFNREVLQYDIAKDEWIPAGVIPFDTPVTTTAVRWKKHVFIPSGEIKAGVRTPQVLQGKIKQQ